MFGYPRSPNALARGNRHIWLGKEPGPPAKDDKDEKYVYVSTCF